LESLCQRGPKQGARVAASPICFNPINPRLNYFPGERAAVSHDQAPVPKDARYPPAMRLFEAKIVGKFVNYLKASPAVKIA
jgi:hypothetical protein